MSKMNKRRSANRIRRGTVAEYVADVTRALERAGERARETAMRTGTPLVVYRNGRIEKIAVTSVRREAPD